MSITKEGAFVELTSPHRSLRVLTFLEALAFSDSSPCSSGAGKPPIRYSWIIFPIWLIASFLLHRDTPKTLGWRADNLWPATRQGLWMFADLRRNRVLWPESPSALYAARREHLLDHHRFVGYFAFCLLQQVAVNSYLMNRFLFATSTPPCRSSAS